MISELRPYEERDLEGLVSSLQEACTWLDLSRVLEEKLGPGAGGVAPDITVARVDDAPIGVAVTCRDRLRLLAVAPSHRNRGLGTILLAAAESDLCSHGHKRISTLDEGGNYLSPGIDERDQHSIAWLRKRGFEPTEVEYESLTIELSGNQKVTDETRDAAIAKAAAAGYEIERLSAQEAPALVESIGTEYSPAWATEVKRAETDVFVAKGAGAIVAFAAHDGNNRGLGWFGPAGTRVPHQRKGLGAALLLACLRDVAKQGHKECTISWIGPRSFYDRVAGIAATRRYLVFRKPIDPRE